MTNQDPLNVLTGGYEVYFAEVGTAVPAPGAAPTTPWKLLGKGGKLDQTDTGVSIKSSQSVETFRGGSTAIRKAVRSEEDIMTTIELMDVRQEILSLMLNGNAVTLDSAGTPKTSTMKLGRGSAVVYVALLIIGDSPESATGKRFYHIPKCYQSGDMEIVHSKKDAAIVALEFTAVAGPNATGDDPDLGEIIDVVD